MKLLLTSILTITILLIISTIIAAQGAPGLPDAPDPTPIDGGLGLLAAAGGVYAWKKLRNKNTIDTDC